MQKKKIVFVSVKAACVANKPPCGVVVTNVSNKL